MSAGHQHTHRSAEADSLLLKLKVCCALWCISLFISSRPSILSLSLERYEVFGFAHSSAQSTLIKSWQLSISLSLFCADFPSFFSTLLFHTSPSSSLGKNPTLLIYFYESLVKMCCLEGLSSCPVPYLYDGRWAIKYDNKFVRILLAM